jgi:hypothetical protein
MIKKRNNFIDEHIEKVALVIGGIAAIYVLYAFVLRGPELIFDNQKFRPGQLDIYIVEQSEKLKERLAREPIPKPPYLPQSVSFLAKMNSVLDTNLNVLWPVPSSVETMVDKKYRMPVIGSVNDVSVEHIRAAAYMPKVAVTAENADTQETYEPNDLDLVTVQASFDLAPLIDSFQECFAGKEVPDEWRDAGLVKPVFAAVQLQRQRLGDNGEWGQWEDVPRVKIDPKRDDYKIIEDVNGLPSGGVMVQLAKFSALQVQVALLQPEPYKIASAEDDWLPPSLHRKFLAVRKEKDAQERRDAATERETKAAEERTARSTREGGVTERPRVTTEQTSRTTTTPSRAAGAGSAGDRGGARAGVAGGGGQMGGGATARNPSRAPTPKPAITPERDRRTESTTTTDQKKTAKPVVTEVMIYDEMKKMLLARKDISKLRETVTLWAYDDTVEPGASYQYRIRLGVFNPVAGAGQVREEDADKDSKVILWSEFSDVTDVVAIDKRLYFFPVNVQEAAMAAEVQVCKYVLGYWHSEPFMVKRGDVIGRVARVEPSDKDKIANVKLPERIDYATGAVVVDMIAMNDWSGDKTLQSRQYFDMLFSFDGTSVERLPAKQMYWPEELRLKYSELKTLEKRPKEPWRAWGNTGATEVQQRGMPGDGMRRGPMDRGGEMQDGMPDRRPGR